MDVLRITPNDYPPLLESIEFDLNYDVENELWIAENDKFLLRSSGETFQELKEHLIDFIDYNVDVHIINRNSAPAKTENFRIAIDNLEKIIDINKRPYQDHWEYVDLEDED